MSYVQEYIKAGLEHPATLEIPLDVDRFTPDLYIEPVADDSFTAYRGTPSYKIASIAVSRTNHGRSLTTDELYCRDAHRLAADQTVEDAVAQFNAAGMHKIINTVMGRYTGEPGLPAATYLDMPFEIIKPSLQPDPNGNAHRLNWGLLRGISDYAVATNNSYRVPLPGRVRQPVEGINANSLKDLKKDLPRNFFGVLAYTSEAEPDVTIEEYYRAKKHVGTLSIRSLVRRGKHEVEAVDHNRSLVDFETVPYEGSPLRRVRFLKALAQHPDLTKLVLDL